MTVYDYLQAFQMLYAVSSIRTVYLRSHILLFPVKVFQNLHLYHLLLVKLRQEFTLPLQFLNLRFLTLLIQTIHFSGLRFGKLKMSKTLQVLNPRVESLYQEKHNLHGHLMMMTQESNASGMVVTLTSCRLHLQGFHLLVEPMTSPLRLVELRRRNLIEQSLQLPHIEMICLD